MSFTYYDTTIVGSVEFPKKMTDVFHPEEHQYGKTQARLDPKEAIAPVEKVVVENFKPDEPVVTQGPPVEYYPVYIR